MSDSIVLYSPPFIPADSIEVNKWVVKGFLVSSPLSSCISLNLIPLFFFFRLVLSQSNVPTRQKSLPHNFQQIRAFCSEPFSGISRLSIHSNLYSLAYEIVLPAPEQPWRWVMHWEGAEGCRDNGRFNFLRKKRIGSLRGSQKLILQLPPPAAGGIYKFNSIVPLQSSSAVKQTNDSKLRNLFTTKSPEQRAHSALIHSFAINSELRSGNVFYKQRPICKLVESCT